MKKRLKQASGFTLVEMLITAYILLIGICGILSLIINSMSSSKAAWDLTTATTHAEYILEQMQNSPSLADITMNDWADWAVKQKLNTLPGEKYKIIYEDPAADPLDIQVIVNWKSQSRLNTMSLKTKLTK